MWTSKAGLPEAAEENFAPSRPPVRAPLWSNSVKTAARLWVWPSVMCQITVEFRKKTQIPAAAKASNPSNPVKTRTALGPLLPPPAKLAKTI